MSIEQFFLLSVQVKGIQQIYEEAFVNPTPEAKEATRSFERQESAIPPKPRRSPAAQLSWWLGIRLVKTGRRFLQYAR